MRVRDPLHALNFNPEAETEARSPPGQWRLLSVALVCWALTAWAILSPGRGGVIALCAAVAGSLLLLGWWLTRHGRLSTIAVSLLTILFGCLVVLGCRVHAVEGQRAAPEFQRAAASGTTLTFAATLTGFPEKKQTAFGSREWVRISAIAPVGKAPGGTVLEGAVSWNSGRGASVRRASVPMLLWLSDTELPKEAKRWGPGTVLSVTATLKTQPAADAVAYTANPSAMQQLDERGGQVGSAAAVFRSLLMQHAANVPHAELVPGFAVGDTSLVPEPLNDAMLESSLSHLTAVSGSNTGLVIAAMSWCASCLGASRRWRAIAGGAALAAFVTVVGPDSSVLRAAAMAAVLLVGAFGGRRASALPALGLAVLALLIVDPWQALQAGFALSVAATLGILLLATPIAHWLCRRVRLPRILALPLSVAVSAQFACGPLLLLLQPGIPAVGIIANLIAAPAAPLGTGLGLIAAILGPLSPRAAVLAVYAASLPASWVAATAQVCSQLPAGRWSWPEGWAGALLLAACQLSFVAAWALATGRLGLSARLRVSQRQPWRAKSATPVAISVMAATLASGAFAVIVAVTMLHPLATRLATPNDWMFVACDVGQGDAVLARSPDAPQVVMLVDTGDNPAALDECLSRFGVDRISLLVLTHDDRDHVGALESVLTRVDATLIAPTVLGEQLQHRPVVRMLEAAQVPFLVGAAGDTGKLTEHTGSSGGFSWQVLAPRSGDTLSETNAASLVLLLEIDGHRALMLADTAYEQQSRLIHDQASRATLDRIDVLKVAHHGSRDQDMSLFERVSATWGLVSVGAENRYGHPTDETLAALARAGTQTLRTDVHGSVAIVEKHDGTLEAWVERGDETEP